MGLGCRTTSFISSSTSFWYQFLHFDSPIPSPVTSSLFDSPLCTLHIITLSFTTEKTYLFHKYYPLLVVSLFPPGLPARTIARTVSYDLLGFYFYFSLLFRFSAVR